MGGYHLCILRRSYLDSIVADRKKVESRFSRTRRGAFGRVKTGDKIFFKVSNGPVRAVGVAAEVKQFEDLTAKRMKSLKRQYNNLILGSDEYWRDRENCRYGMLIWLRAVKEIEPVSIDKKDWRAWVVLSGEDDFGLAGKMSLTF